ncbi:MAG: acyltransferase family protein [Candidatus Acidiferrales bacterium]
MPELDSVRGIAILGVVLCHGFFWSSGLTGLSGITRFLVSITRFGGLGVNLFFVLSGFLITGILVEMRSGPRYYSKFYFRRVIRILPALYALLLVLCFVPGQNRAYILLSAFFLANIAPILHVPYTYGMLWSLAVEEHFYFVWPLAVRNLRTRVLMYFAAGIVVASPILRGLWFRKPLPEGFGEFTWLVADGLAMGALLALLVREPWFKRKHLLWFSVGAVFCTLLLLGAGAPFGVLTRREILGAAFVLSAVHLCFVGVLGLFLLAGTSRFAYLVNWRALRFYGEISYGLYLYHWLVFIGYDAAVHYFWPTSSFLGHPGLLFLRFGVVLSAATLLSYFSRWQYEQRFLALKYRVSRPV